MIRFFKKIPWSDIMTTLSGFIVLLQTVYPHATGESIVAAFADGTWLSKAINLAFAYFLIRYRRGSNGEHLPASVSVSSISYQGDNNG